MNPHTLDSDEFSFPKPLATNPVMQTVVQVTAAEVA